MTTNLTSRGKSVLAKIHSEGYCCLKGYLGLCRARGESAQGMAENLSISPDAIWHHYRRLKQGAHTCQGLKDCLQPVIDAIQNDKAP